jgi:hypothetical protein
MPTFKLLYGTRTQFALDSNLASLANNAAKPIGKIDNTTTLAQAYRVDLSITLGTGVSSTGTVEVYLIESEDDSSYTDGISPTGTSDVASSIKNAMLIDVLTANVASTVVRKRLVIPVVAPEKYQGVVVYNKSGAAFASSTHSAYYMPINTQSV